MDTAYDVVRVPNTNSIASREAVTFYGLSFAVDLVILKLKMAKSLGAGIGIKLSLLLRLPFNVTRGIGQPATVVSSFFTCKDRTVVRTFNIMLVQVA
jgi:hypothetical protein